MIAARWRSVWAAWENPASKRGLLGTLLIVLGSLSPAYLPQNIPWKDWFRSIGLESWVLPVASSIAVAGGVTLLLWAWLSIRPTTAVTTHPGVAAAVQYWAIAFWWILPLLFAPPIFSHDAYSYAGEGWLLQNGLNPYDYPVSALSGEFTDQVAWVWRENTAMYPPLSLRIFQFMVIFAGQNPYLAAVLMRIPALLGVILSGYFLPRIAGRIAADVDLTRWFGAFNPLLLVVFVGGAHNDALMMGIVIWALWLGYTFPQWLGKRWRKISAQQGAFLLQMALPAILIGIAAAIKQPALLAVYPIGLLGYRWGSWKWSHIWRVGCRLGITLAISVASFALTTQATGLGYGWLKATGVPGKIVTLAPFSWAGAVADFFFHGTAQVAIGDTLNIFVRVAGLLLMLFLIVRWLVTVGRGRPLAFLSWSYLAFAGCGLSMYSWYLSWGGVLLPLSNPRPRAVRIGIWITVLLLGYEALNLAVRNGAFLLGIPVF